MVSIDIFASVLSDLSGVSSRLGYPGGIKSWLSSTPIGHLSCFLSFCSSRNKVSLEKLMAAFRLAMSNSSNLVWNFFCFFFVLSGLRAFKSDCF